jgi:flagellar biosynthesis protein FliR
MNELLARLLDLGASGLLAGFVVFLRVGGAMAVLPAFGEQMVPARVRLVLALGFTVITAPAVAHHIAPIVAEGQVVGLFIATEAFAGVLVGLVLRMFVLCLQIAGTIAAQSTSLSQIFGGIGGEPMPAVSQLLMVGGLALAVMAGLHVKIVELLVLSYDMMPAGRFPGAADVMDWGLGNVTRVFTLAFSLAAPFVIASLIYNAALGAINRAMPQLMVAFVGAPALTLGGLVLMALALPVALMVWAQALDGWFADPFGAP